MVREGGGEKERGEGRGVGSNHTWVDGGRGSREGEKWVNEEEG